MSSDLPYAAEYAKSNRAGCKLCGSNIAKDSLRLAVMVQSPHFDGKVPNWFHFSCFWKRARVKETAEIHGFDSLRWEDQQKVKEKLAGGGSDVKVYSDYACEYAKSSQSTCRCCENKIGKGELRLSKKDFESQRAKMFGPQDLWYHVDCFASSREQLEFTTDKDPTKITGFAKLLKESKDVLLLKLGKGEMKKRKADNGSATTAKKAKLDKEELALKEQNQVIWQYRDSLQREVSLDALRVLLEYNKQEVCSGESRLLDSVSDAMAFGSLEPCPECGGQLRFSGSNSGYRCTGNVTEWTKCQYFTIDPKRRAFKIPKEFHDVAFLKNYKYVARARVIPKIIECTATQADLCALSVPIQPSKDLISKPLHGMLFAIIGKTTLKKVDLIDKITELGGKVTSSIDLNTTACISTQAEVQKLSKAVKQAKERDVKVIDEVFLETVGKSGEPIGHILTKHKISSWGSDTVGIPIKQSPAPVGLKSLGKSTVSAKDEAYFTKSIPSTMKMTVKGGAAVDPESGLADKAHVLQESKTEVYNAVLGMVDILKGTNSYYKLQVLESDKKIKWWVFRAWGRVGTTIGGNKLESFGSKVNAIKAFVSLYGEKTGNEWENRASFKKVPNKFYPLDIDYGNDESFVCKLDETDGSQSTLHPDVQNLIRLIFDVESMKKAMLEYEIDLKKMPLGKLSKKQIENAYTILSELCQLIEKGGTPTQFIDASNRFYTLIPHDFGMKKPTILDTADAIQIKTDMLDNLLDIEIAYSMLKTGDENAKDPLDVHYEKLKTKIQVMDKTCEHYQRLEDYVRNTHAATHQHFELDVINIFEIEREGEARCYRPFKDLPNRKLLWHGSRTTNYAGILSQGLRIAPPEAPVTGYMFGKGIYFADMVSKSANYCHTSKSNPVGLLLLSEVALGNIHELTSAEYIKKLPKGKHSTKGCGMTCPNPSDTYVDPDGVEIPLGKGVDSCIGQSSLLYNDLQTAMKLISELSDGCVPGMSGYIRKEMILKSLASNDWNMQ